MNRRLCTWSIVAATAAIVLLTVGLLAERRPTVVPPVSQTVPSLSSVTTHPTTAYRLGVWEERLAVFRGAAVSPDRVYDVWISALPPDEQARLRCGIDCDAAALERLLEDYTS